MSKSNNDGFQFRAEFMDYIEGMIEQSQNHQNVLKKRIAELERQVNNLSLSVEKMKLNNQSWLQGVSECHQILGGLLED